MTTYIITCSGEALIQRGGDRSPRAVVPNLGIWFVVGLGANDNSYYCDIIFLDKLITRVE